MFIFGAFYSDQWYHCSLLLYFITFLCIFELPGLKEQAENSPIILTVEQTNETNAPEE